VGFGFPSRPHIAIAISGVDTVFAPSIVVSIRISCVEARRRARQVGAGPFMRLSRCVFCLAIGISGGSAIGKMCAV
jgi:hypothetical protein